ncbi:MAG TPA: hypothetical protein VF489_13825 [Sphingobium sp.]
MADDFATVAVAQHSNIPPADGGRSIPAAVVGRTAADRAERAVDLLSRWAGILAFVGAVAAIVWSIL